MLLIRSRKLVIGSKCLIVVYSFLSLFVSILFPSYIGSFSLDLKNYPMENSGKRKAVDPWNDIPGYFEDCEKPSDLMQEYESN